MLVSGINEAATAPADVARPIDPTDDSGSRTFTDALASAKDTVHDGSSAAVPANNPATTPKVVAPPTNPDAPPKSASSAAFTRGPASLSQTGILSRPTKISSSSSSAVAPNQKPETIAPAISVDPTTIAAALPAMPAAAPVPVSIPPAPDAASAPLNSTIPPVNASPVGATSIVQAGAQAVSSFASSDAQGSDKTLAPPEAPAATLGDVDNVGGAAVAVDAADAADPAKKEPVSATDSTGMQDEPSQALQAGAAQASDAAQSPMALGLTPVMQSELSSPQVSPQVSSQPAAQAHHGPAAQPAAATPDETAGPVVGATASQAPSLPADGGASVTAGTTSSAISAFAQQKNGFVAATLRTVSSSIASVIQAPFTSATPELSKNPAPVAQVAPSSSAGASAATSQPVSSGGSGTGSNAQSSSSHGNSQPGSSSSQDTFSGHAPVDTPAPIQSANDASTIGASAIRADAIAAQSSPANASVTAASAEKSSAGAELSGSLQTAAPSASAPSNSDTLPGAQISQAHLFGGAGGAEMRISINTDTLGPIELQATSEKDRIGAVIAAAKPETQELLTNELPTLQQALSERNVQIQQLTISQGALAGGMSGRGGYSQSPDAWQRQAAANYWRSPSETASSTEDVPGAIVSVAAAPGKLSVHA